MVWELKFKFFDSQLQVIFYQNTVAQWPLTKLSTSLSLLVIIKINITLSKPIYWVVWHTLTFTSKYNVNINTRYSVLENNKNFNIKTLCTKVSLILAYGPAFSPTW